MKFTELTLDEKLLKGIIEAGYETLMPVQEETLVHTLEGRDAYVQSQTGTGKTAAFLITIFQAFLDERSSIKRKRALVIAPTRELAVQIDKEAKLLGRYLDFKTECFYGGVGYESQEKALENNVDIIIGTPGRLLDFHFKGKLDFNTTGILVIDEADRLFDMGFLPDIRRIVDSMSRRLKRQTMLFSATMDERTRAITGEYMKNPAHIEIMPEQVTVATVTQELYHVAEREKMNLLLGIIKKETPKTMLIFTNMKHTAATVAKKMELNGFKCQYISGDLPQSKRLRVINSFKDGSLSYLAATDVAARGLHIDDLELIVNYDLPQDCENYVHRIGRTARAGKSGKAISLVCENYVYNLEAIENYIGMKIPVVPADENLFQEDKTTGMNLEKPERGKRTPTHHREKTGEKPSGRKPSDHPRKPSTGKKTESEYKHREKDKTEKHEKPVKYEKRERPDKQDKNIKSESFSEKKRKPYAHKEQDPKKRQYKKYSKEKTDKTPDEQPKSNSQQDRLEYYKKKYGENFQVKPELGRSSKSDTSFPTLTPPKESFLKKLFGIFKKKNT